jgi:aerobic-type carbon monoxide dehydrogenase small subunit (CoxS/CutS family)
VAATALLAEQPTPDAVEVREWMTGNLCRCTGYDGIVASVLAAADDVPGDR